MEKDFYLNPGHWALFQHAACRPEPIEVLSLALHGPSATDRPTEARQEQRACTLGAADGVPPVARLEV
jgi:hypothetical protein